MMPYLNIGAGNAALPGFSSVHQLPHADLCHDVRQGLPFADHTVAGIHCENQLEYLDQGQGLLFLRECRRVLQPDAILRIATPDLNAQLAAYLDGTLAAPDAAGASPAEALNLQLRGAGRQWSYNAQELARAVVQAGLNNPLRRQPHDSAMAALAGQAAGADGQLILECTPWKPALEALPLVSIVIPAYRVRYLGAALDSALAQTYANIEILVLDDSADDAIERSVASRAGVGAGRLRYLRNSPRLGEDLSLTRGIRAAQGQLIKPLYDDDRLLPDCVARMVEGMRACPAATLLLSRRYTINAAGARTETQTMSLANQSCEMSGLSVAAFTLAIRANLLGPPPSLMFRRDDALAVATPHVMTFAGRTIYGAGDVALCLNLLGRGDAVFLMDLLSEFRVHDEHTSSAPGVAAQAGHSWRYMSEHGQRMGLRPDDADLKIKRLL